MTDNQDNKPNPKWRPIEEASKDYTHIVRIDNGFRLLLCEWDFKQDCWTFSVTGKDFCVMRPHDLIFLDVHPEVMNSEL